MAAEHEELVREMGTLEKMSHAERVKHAKRRRLQQLKAFQQYDKKEEKGTKKSKTNTKAKPQRHLKFVNSVQLFDAAIRNDLEEAESLLQSGVDPNLPGGDSLSVLHQCCLNDLPDMMKLFIRYGADVNARDCDHWTPLHLSATCGNIALCQCLCNNGANLLALNTDGNMPYDLCDDMPTLDFIESEMAKRGITQELIDETRLLSENEMLKDIIQLANAGGDLNSKGASGETHLHVAACMGYGKVIDYLLNKKVPVTTADNEGWQAHHLATYYGQYHVLESLLLAGADPNAKTNNKETLMSLCDIEAQIRVQQLLIDIKNRSPNKLQLPSTMERNNSTRRGSQATLHAGRRSSIHDKASFAHRDAIEEGQRLQGSIVLTEELDEDESEKDTDFIEIPAITVKPPPVSNVVTPAKSILKLPPTKPSPSGQKLKSDDIWASSTSPPQQKKNAVTPTDRASSPPKKGRERSDSSTPTTAAKSNSKQSPGSQTTDQTKNNNNNNNNSTPKSSSNGRRSSNSSNDRKFSESDKQNGRVAAPGTLSDLKKQRQKERENKQPNGNANDNKNPGDIATDGRIPSRSSTKKKFKNQNEVVVADDKNCCIIC